MPLPKREGKILPSILVSGSADECRDVPGMEDPIRVRTTIVAALMRLTVKLRCTPIKDVYRECTVITETHTPKERT